MVNGSIQRKKSEEMEASYHRHDICDKVWALMELHLSGQRGQWGGIAQDNRRFINAVFWVLRTGVPGVTCRQIMGNGACSPTLHSVAQKRTLASKKETRGACRRF